MIVASLYDLIKRRNDPYYVSIGASGAVSAVLFTSIFLDPWGKILFFAVCLSPESYSAWLYLAYCQYMAKQTGDNINHNAHFYGAIYGIDFPNAAGSLRYCISFCLNLRLRMIHPERII